MGVVVVLELWRQTAGARQRNLRPRHPTAAARYGVRECEWAALLAMHGRRSVDVAGALRGIGVPFGRSRLTPGAPKRASKLVCRAQQLVAPPPGRPRCRALADIPAPVGPVPCHSCRMLATVRSGCGCGAQRRRFDSGHRKTATPCCWCCCHPAPAPSLPFHPVPCSLAPPPLPAWRSVAGGTGICRVDHGSVRRP